MESNEQQVQQQKPQEDPLPKPQGGDQPEEHKPGSGSGSREEPVKEAATKDKNGSDDDSEDDDDEEVIEESPCGRYIKRREVVKYRDVPGIDTAYLAMDAEEGVEVVWNEAIFSGSKKFKSKDEDKLKNVFEALTLIDHPNIVKFHRFWTDGGVTNEKTGQKEPPRLVFITEYMSSGSLKQFLRKTKKNNRKIQVQSWKRWCTQILSALNYLHATCDPPILHGNLTCDTIFIQHNGLVKIGSVAPDIIHQNVKTCRENIARNRHFLAPEWGTASEASLNTAIDIYAFGMCALETAALELLPANPPPGTSSSNNGHKEPAPSAGVASSSASNAGNGNHHQNGNNGHSSADGEVSLVTEESIARTIDSLEDEMQKDFIRKCLRKNPEERPTARELLFHPVLFEVHSLKLLAAHILVNTPEVDTTNVNETMTDEAIQTHYGRDTVMATVRRHADGKIIEYKLSDFPVAEKLEKFMEDVKYGIYPLTAFALSQPPPAKTRAVTPEGPNESAQSVTPEPLEPEDRWGLEFKCLIGPPVPAPPTQLTLLSKLCDGINRQMQATILHNDTPELLAFELLENAIINWRDVPSIARMMTFAYIQRANETAEYLAANENHTVIMPDEASSAAAVPEPPPGEFTPTAGVQCPPVPDGDTEPKPTVEQQLAEHEAQQDESEVLEDPTPPQPLEGRWAGLEPIVGTPQMTLAEAVSAGTTHGGLHFPKGRMKFVGVVADIDHKLEAEIMEWHKRMQEYLVEVALQQQQQQQQLQQQQQQLLIQQNGAQQQILVNEADDHEDQGITVVAEEVGQ